MADPSICALQGLSYDIFSDSCVESGAGMCFWPYVWDFESEQCVYQQPGPSTFDNPGSSTTQENVTVNVTNAVNIADQTLSNVADAVKGAISQGASSAANVAKQASDDVINAVKGVADKISSSIADAFSTLWDWIKGVGEFIKNNAAALITAIKDNVAGAISDIAAGIKSILGPIADTIHSVATEVQSINDTLIQPISNVINTTIKTISNLTTAIETDLHSGLSGILQIPTDIANGLTSLDGTLQRTVTQLGQANKDTLTSVILGPFGDVAGKPLKAVGDTFTSVTGNDARKTTFTDHVKLPEPGQLGVSADLIAATWKQIQNVISSLLHHGQDNIGAIKAQLSGVPFLLGDIVELPTTLVLIAMSIIAELRPLLEYESGQANAAMGLEKLSPGDAIAAWLRQFIDDKTLTAELSVHGYDAERIQVIKDLQIQLLDVAAVLDMRFRGIVTEDDLRLNLLQHGFAPADQDALIEASYRLVDVSMATRAWFYSFLSDEQLRAILRQNRFTDNEIQLFFSTALRLEGMADTIERKKRQTLWINDLLTDQTLLTPPDDVVAAAKRDGQHGQVAADAWMGQFSVPPMEQWLTLFFRGIRTHKELMAAMDYYAVPQEWRDDYIRANSALIPFRTIPTMLAAGIIDTAYAKQQLAAHGFDLEAVNALLKYATVHKTAAVAAQAADLKSVSVASARTAYFDGALTTDQYTAILKAHGADDTAAALTIKVETMQDHAKNRSQTAQDLINEALAGFITSDAVAAALNTAGYTLAEQAKYLKQLRRATTAKAKVPAEPELKKFWRAGIITEADYRSAMAANGYAEQWIDAFATLDAPLPAATGG